MINKNKLIIGSLGIVLTILLAQMGLGQIIGPTLQGDITGGGDGRTYGGDGPDDAILNENLDDLDLSNPFSGGAWEINEGNADVLCTDENLWSTHEHIYENTSVPDEGYAIRARITEYRIYLEEDFMNNVDFDSIRCSARDDDGDDYVVENCIDGYESDSHGGMSITYVEGDTSSDAVTENYFKWEYGLDDYYGSIVIDGYNDWDEDGDVDDDDENARFMSEAISFMFDDTIESGSARTNAGVWIKFAAFDQSCPGGTGDADCWEDIDEDTDPGNTDFHWNIESTEIQSTYYCPEEEEEPACANLSVTPNVTDVNDLFINWEFEVTATDTNGDDMTEDLTYDYRAYSYDSYPTTPDNGRTPADAEGSFRIPFFGVLWWDTGDNYRYDTSNTTLQFGSTQPGDTITVVANDYEDVCYAEIEFPYCADLTINDPTGNPFVTGDELDIEIDITVTAEKKSSSTYQEDWPYEIDYESTDPLATFDGNFSIYETDPQDTHIDNYISSESGTVDVYANPDQDPKGFCHDAFTYTMIPDEEEEACDYLTITNPTSNITVEAMDAGDVLIEWESYMTDGSRSLGPWEVYSTPAGGTFTDVIGFPLTVWDASIPSYMTVNTELLYNGNPGDTITIRDVNYTTACADSIGSEERPAEYYCDSLTLDGPYLADGTFVDVTVDPEVIALYDQNYACFPFEIQVDDVSYSNDLIAQSSNAASTIELTVNETGPTTTSGLGSTSQTITGFTNYTGEVCVTDYAELDHLEVYMDGEIAACYAEFTFPTLPEEPMACEFLGMSPNVVSMAADATDAGTVNITINVAGDNPLWQGDLMVEATDPSGAPPGGDLYYPDGSYAGPYLVMPASGLISTFNLTYVGGQPGDIITAYINGEEVPCLDQFTIYQEDAEACDILYFDTGIFNITENDTQDGSTTLHLESDLSSQTVIVEYTGCSSEIIEYEGASWSSPLTITGVSDSDTFDLNFVGLCEDALITAYVSGWEAICEDEITVNLNEEVAPACYDLSFDTNTVQIDGPGESLTTTLTLTSDLEDQTLDISYDGCEGGEIIYDGVNYIDTLNISGIDGNGTWDLEFTNLCADASIQAEIEDHQDDCADEIQVTEDLPVCIDLSFDTSTVEIDGPGESLTTTLTLNSELENQTLDISYDGCEGGEIIYDGVNYIDTLNITGINGNESWDLEFTNLCANASIRAEIEDHQDDCAAEIQVTEDLPVCIDLSFDWDDEAIIEGEDLEVELNLNSELEDQTLIIEYSCDEDIEVEYNGTGVSGSGEIEIEGIDGSESFDLTFTDVCEDLSIEAYIEGEENDCYDSISPDVLLMGDFEKYIFTFNFATEKNSYSDEGVFFSHDEDRAFYTLEYDPAGTEDQIIFTDEMWTGDLNGFLGDGSDSGGYIYLAESYDELTNSSVYGYSTIERFGFGSQHEANSDELAYIVQGWTDNDYHTFVPYVQYDDGSESDIIPECDYDYDDDDERVLDTNEVCYDPEYSPETTGSIVIENAGEVEERDDDATIRIRYVGIVVSQLNCASQTDDCLLEEFENDAEVDVYDITDPLDADARLVVLCSYLVTRNAGDVYLEVGLEGGSDVSCIFADEDGSTSSDYSNTDGVVVQDSEGTDDDSDNSDSDSDTDTSSTLSTSYSDFTVSFCDDSSDGSLISNLSSYVCEIVTSVSDLWKKTSVEQTTDDRITQATRNVVTNQNSSTSYFSNWDDLYSTLHNQNNPDSGILYFDGSLSSEITIDGLEIPQGAWTLIVENATLKITEDIDYAATTDFTDMPSMAFVITGGDIYIQNTAAEVSGVYYTDQSFTGNSRSAVNEPLTFYGSVYGHIQPLLDAANYVGPPTLDGGGIVVRYDSRIILNTPPGLSEYVDVNTQQGVN